MNAKSVAAGILGGALLVDWWSQDKAFKSQTAAYVAGETPNRSPPPNALEIISAVGLLGYAAITIARAR